MADDFGGGGSRSISPLAVVITLIVLAAAGFTYYVVTQESSVPEAKAVCTLVIDRTGSSESEAIKENYLAAATDTIQGCRKDAGVLSIYSIDGTSGRSELVGEPAKFFDADQKKDVLLAQQLDDLEEQANATVEEVLSVEATSGGGSEILSALEETAKASNASYGDLSVPQYMVILTDGLQNSPQGGVSVRDLIAGTVSVEDLVTQVGQAGMEPLSLSRFLVNMVGVQAGEGLNGAPIPPEIETRIESFWTTIFENAGAELCFYGKQVRALPIDC